MLQKEQNNSLEISKSQKKRDVEYLQNLGVSLTKLSTEQLKKIPLPAPLLQAINEYKKIKSNSAKRRQAQYIGKLMRQIDTQPINDAYQNLLNSHQSNTKEFHLIEKWREKLLLDPKDNLTEFISAYPQTDAQQLRSILKKATIEQNSQKNHGFKRKLFQFIKETMAHHQD